MLRRLRRAVTIIFSGQISKQVYFYVQPDFASSVSSTSLNFTQLRDAYMDIGIDKENEFRIRLGQSKIPFGFANLQSSQNRLPLDRDDALNSAFSNERSPFHNHDLHHSLRNRCECFSADSTTW